jgi:hypothetical protein
MFGRPAEAPGTSPKPAAVAPDGWGRGRLSELSQRPVPPGLVPWLIPLLIVFACVVILVLPGAVAVAVLLVLVFVPVALIGLRRYRFIKSRDDYERPGNEAIFRDLDGSLRERKYSGRNRGR